MPSYERIIESLTSLLQPYVPGITSEQVSQLLLVLLIGGVVLIITAIVVQILYLLTLAKALKKCSPANREMPPGLVWLELIPVFNLIWRFFNVINVSDSLGREFRSRNMNEEASPARTSGMLYSIFSCGGVIPLIGSFLVLILAPIFWMIYWVRIRKYSKKLDPPPLPGQ
ncbi:hypothetical protein STSP2_00458 [Anaerohalosphaera lusitana]|uniref:DUF4328 domain-containing protein n=1 Tax=Anaerohalosphaera lusitana TaxID=1936003 RepID=A0A1U9NHM9_9BACT|nr:hypothetical protein [Anaerohalosphaera lusitana]AQT67315.1 hypothetical protein STSP2_00458 [Anaerohalosphaera lusitana]